MGLAWRGLLLVLLSSLCHGSFLIAGKDLIAITGPLSQNKVGLHNEAMPTNVLGCSKRDLQVMTEQLPVLQKYGVTHYKIYLNWNFLLKDETQVQCYRSLLQALASVSIRPVGVLHIGDLGGLPTSITEDKPTEFYIKYADFAFHTFGDLVHTWITFDVPKEETLNPQYLQFLIEAHEKISTLYHTKYLTAGESSASAGSFC